jgi:thiosulfate reductase cytochrome b subunit
VLNGLLYVSSGVANRHFRKNLVPARGDLTWRSLSEGLAGDARDERAAARYNVLQRTTYLAVVFVLFPLMIWTGLAMSPAITSVFPVAVTVLGGHQCARTIHFFAAIVLVLFVAVHIAMVWRSGFRRRVGGMITGQVHAGRKGL